LKAGFYDLSFAFYIYHKVAYRLKKEKASHPEEPFLTMNKTMINFSTYSHACIRAHLQIDGKSRERSRYKGLITPFMLKRTAYRRFTACRSGGFLAPNSYEAHSLIITEMFQRSTSPVITPSRCYGLGLFVDCAFVSARLLIV
jgi:hypothetical protein